MKSSGVTAVAPGSIATRSTPRSTSAGHSRSANWQARSSAPSDTAGATFLAPKPRPKWPMNIARAQFPGCYTSNASLTPAKPARSIRLTVRLGDYLDRVGVTAPPGTGAAALRQLHLAHSGAFLFENLSIQTGGRISLALADLE